MLEPDERSSNGNICSAGFQQADEAVRIGVYTCYCGGNISKVVACEEVAEAMRGLPNVVVSRTNMSLCSDAGQSMIEKDIREKGVNRVVIGACAPSLHEQTFRNTVMRAGLNPYLYQHMGLREQDSWVHQKDSNGATEKAVRLMSAGVAKARLLRPLENFRLDAERHVLVIGGGVAGMRSALEIVRQGLKVTLVEKSPFLGGHTAQLDTLFPTDESAQALLQRLFAEIDAHPDIKVMTYAEVVNVTGYVGNFNITIEQHAARSGEFGCRGVDGSLRPGYTG